MTYILAFSDMPERTIGIKLIRPRRSMLIRATVSMVLSIGIGALIGISF
jgi:hypothetical protein